jgi:hypothetical protein
MCCGSPLGRRVWRNQLRYDNALSTSAGPLSTSRAHGPQQPNTSLRYPAFGNLVACSVGHRCRRVRATSLGIALSTLPDHPPLPLLRRQHATHSGKLLLILQPTNDSLMERSRLRGESESPQSSPQLPHWLGLASNPPDFNVPAGPLASVTGVNGVNEGAAPIGAKLSPVSFG